MLLFRLRIMPWEVQVRALEARNWVAPQMEEERPKRRRKRVDYA